MDSTLGLKASAEFTTIKEKNCNFIESKEQYTPRRPATWELLDKGCCTKSKTSNEEDGLNTVISESKELKDCEKIILTINTGPKFCLLQSISRILAEEKQFLAGILDRVDWLIERQKSNFRSTKPSTQPNRLHMMEDQDQTPYNRVSSLVTSSMTKSMPHLHTLLVTSKATDEIYQGYSAHDARACPRWHIEESVGGTGSRPGSTMSNYSEKDSGFDELRASSITPSSHLPNSSLLKAASSFSVTGEEKSTSTAQIKTSCTSTTENRNNPISTRNKIISTSLMKTTSTPSQRKSIKIKSSIGFDVTKKTPKSTEGRNRARTAQTQKKQINDKFHAEERERNIDQTFPVPPSISEIKSGPPTAEESDCELDYSRSDDGYGPNDDPSFLGDFSDISDEEIVDLEDSRIIEMLPQFEVENFDEEECMSPTDNPNDQLNSVDYVNEKNMRDAVDMAVALDRGLLSGSKVKSSITGSKLSSDEATVHNSESSKFVKAEGKSALQTTKNRWTAGEDSLLNSDKKITDDDKENLNYRELVALALDLQADYRHKSKESFTKNDSQSATKSQQENIGELDMQSSHIWQPWDKSGVTSKHVISDNVVRKHNNREMTATEKLEDEVYASGASADKDSENLEPLANARSNEIREPTVSTSNEDRSTTSQENELPITCRGDSNTRKRTYRKGTDWHFNQVQTPHRMPRFSFQNVPGHARVPDGWKYQNYNRTSTDHWPLLMNTSESHGNKLTQDGIRNQKPPQGYDNMQINPSLQLSHSSHFSAVTNTGVSQVRKSNRGWMIDGHTSSRDEDRRNCQNSPSSIQEPVFPKTKNEVGRPKYKKFRSNRSPPTSCNPNYNNAPFSSTPVGPRMRRNREGSTPNFIRNSAAGYLTSSNPRMISPDQILLRSQSSYSLPENKVFIPSSPNDNNLSLQEHHQGWPLYAPAKLVHRLNYHPNAGPSANPNADPNRNANPNANPNTHPKSSSNSNPNVKSNTQNFIKESNRTLTPLSVYLMTEWFNMNLHHPYPSYQEKLHLANSGGITVDQVTSWFGNKRWRERKRLLPLGDTGNSNPTPEMADEGNRKEIVESRPTI